MKILIIQLRRIGDILLTTPVVSYLKTQISNVQIDFLCDPCGLDILKSNPHIDNLFIYGENNSLKELFKVRRRRYDAVIDFMNNPRSRILTLLSGATYRVGYRRGHNNIFYPTNVTHPKNIDYVPQLKLALTENWLSLINLKKSDPVSFYPELYLEKSELSFAESWLTTEQLKPKQFVVMAPASRRPLRQWRWQGFQELAGMIYDRFGLKTLLAWGPGEQDLMNKIQFGHEKIIRLFPDSSLLQAAALLKNAKMLISNTSGNMHMAVAVNTPTITIHGPTRPQDWDPPIFSGGVKHFSVSAPGVSCLGCHLQKCPVGHRCMEKLSSLHIMPFVESILKENQL